MTERRQRAPPDLDAVNCLVVEDSLAGIAAAKGAGMHAVGVPNTYTPDQLREAGADAVIDGLANANPGLDRTAVFIVTRAYNLLNPIAVIRERDATVPCHRA